MNKKTGLFVYDGTPLYRDINGEYCSTTVTNEMLNRFFCVVDKLYLVIRTAHIEETYVQAHLLKLRMDNIEVVELPNFNTPRNFILRSRYNKLFRTIVKDADLFFLRVPGTICNMVADICRKEGKKYLVEVGGCAWDAFWNHGGVMGKCIAPYMFLKMRSTVRSASFASYVTEKWLQKRYPGPGESIAASNVYITAYDDVAIQNRINRYRQNKRLLKIGTIGATHVRYKGQQYIIKALVKLKRKGYLFEYELLGGGSQNYLRKLAQKYGVSEQVKFVGLKPHNEVWNWLDSIDIYAQPSKQEGLPRALIEAMSRGCLAIGSTTAGIPELLEPDMTFKADDITHISNILIQLATTPEEWESRVQRNYEKAKEYDIDTLNGRRTRLFYKYSQSYND